MLTLRSLSIGTVRQVVLGMLDGMDGGHRPDEQQSQHYC
jgi:hypothetical protein